jgi:hypothetical protein
MTKLFFTGLIVVGVLELIFASKIRVVGFLSKFMFLMGFSILYYSSLTLALSHRERELPLPVGEGWGEG